MYLDPGSQAFGWAGVSAYGLAGCGLARCPKNGDIIDVLQLELPGATDLVCLERPVVYPHSKSKAKPNDLMKVGIVGGVGMGIALMKGTRRAAVAFVEPGSWKGQVDPDTMTDRILDTLTAPERALFEKCMGEGKVPKGLWHNTLDAIGLWLHESMRL